MYEYYKSYNTKMCTTQAAGTYGRGGWHEEVVALEEAREPVESAVVQMQHFVLRLAARDHQLAHAAVARARILRATGDRAVRTRAGVGGGGGQVGRRRLEEEPQIAHVPFNKREIFF